MSPCAWVLSAAPHFSFVLPLGVSPGSFAGSVPAAVPLRGDGTRTHQWRCRQALLATGVVAWEGPGPPWWTLLFPLGATAWCLLTKASSPEPRKARQHWGGGEGGAGCQTLSGAGGGLGGAHLVQRGCCSLLRPAVGGSRVVREGGCQGPRRGCLCRCSCGRGVSCFVLGTDRLLALS